MSDKIPGDDWRARLDSLEEAWTGGEAAWDHLHERLHPKEYMPRRKRYPLYWAAAALAALLILGLGIVHEKQQGVEMASSVRKTTSPTHPRVTLPRLAPGAAGAPVPLAVRVVVAKGHSLVAKAHSDDPAPVRQDTPTAAVAPQPSAPTETPSVASMAAAAVASPVGRQGPQRLPIVSINELETNESEPPNGLRKTDHYFQIKLINAQTYIETASEDGHRGQSGGLSIHIHR